MHWFTGRGGRGANSDHHAGPDEAGIPPGSAAFLAPPRRARPVHIDIVCQAAGLTTAAYSFGYVAGWSGGDPATVKATAERVTACARSILDRTGLLCSGEEPASRAAA